MLQVLQDDAGTGLYITSMEEQRQATTAKPGKETVRSGRFELENGGWRLPGRRRNRDRERLEPAAPLGTLDSACLGLGRAYRRRAFSFQENRLNVYLAS